MTVARLLLVEDEFLIRMTLSEALTDAGFEVLEAEDADQALELLASDSTIRLLLTDIQLPGSCNGQVLVERARQTRPALPVIFMSGRLNTSTAGQVGRDRYIAKPYLPSEICSAAHEMIAAAESPSRAEG